MKPLPMTVWNRRFAGANGRQIPVDLEAAEAASQRAAKIKLKL